MNIEEGKCSKCGRTRKETTVYWVTNEACFTCHDCYFKKEKAR